MGEPIRRPAEVSSGSVNSRFHFFCPVCLVRVLRILRDCVFNDPIPDHRGEVTAFHPLFIPPKNFCKILSGEGAYIAQPSNKGLNMRGRVSLTKTRISSRRSAGKPSSRVGNEPGMVGKPPPMVGTESSCPLIPPCGKSERVVFLSEDFCNRALSETSG